MGMDMYLKCNDMELVMKVQDEYWRARRGIAVYWRGATAIHDWFIKNALSPNGYTEEDTAVISVEDLRKLCQTCERVLEDKDRAPELLPASDGEYEIDYFAVISDTKCKLGKILNLLEKAQEPRKADKGEHYGLKFEDDYFFSSNDWIVEFTYSASF